MKEQAQTRKVEWESNNIDIGTNYDGPGVYRIRLFTHGRPAAIPRLGGTDKEGVLAIGCSENIEDRRKQFIQSSKGKRGHSEGIQWWLVKKFHNFEGFSLVFDFIKLSLEDKSSEECRQIQEYFKRYAEAPPLNGSMPKRIRWFEELGSGN
jgi:hypothetical protein